MIPSAVAQQHPAEVTLLTRFVAGDPEAATAVFQQLSADDRPGSELVGEVIGSYADLVLWQRLLHFRTLYQSHDRIESRSRVDDDTLKRARAAIVNLFLKEDDPPAVMGLKSAALSQSLTDPEPGTRQLAATLLGMQGDVRAIPILIETVVAGEHDCQLQAIAALGRLKDERGSLALTEALASDDEELHWAASQALDALKETALPAWIQMLKAPKPHVRWHAACGLGNIGDSRAANSLAEALFDDDFSVRWAAAEALPKLGAPAVPEILQWITRRVLSEDACRTAYHALQQLAPGVDHDRLRSLLEVLRGRNVSLEAPLLADKLLRSW